MKTITFTCETITPMFLSGADQSKPELRPPSIKGALRFWWRAMNGHLVEKKSGKWDYSRLKEEESRIFGGTDEKSGRSKVVIQTHYDHAKFLANVKKANSFKASEKVRWNDGSKTQKIAGQDGGIAYLFYSVLFQNKRDYLSPSNDFDFQLTLKGNNVDFLKKASACIWLVVNFGGVGSRIRRGAGAFSIKSISDDSSVLGDFNFFGDSTESYLQYIDRQLGIIETLFNEERKDKVKPTKFSQFKKKLIIGKAKTTWQEALSEIGGRFKSFRELNEAKAFETPIFGLPIKHKVGFVNLQKANRRSSPLIIQTAKYKNQFYWLALWLEGEFMPNGEKVENGKKYKLRDRHIEKSNVPDNLMHEFLNSIDAISI